MSPSSLYFDFIVKSEKESIILTTQLSEYYNIYEELKINPINIIFSRAINELNNVENSKRLDIVIDFKTNENCLLIIHKQLIVDLRNDSFMNDIMNYFKEGISELKKYYKLETND